MDRRQFGFRLAAGVGNVLATLSNLLVASDSRLKVARPDMMPPLPVDPVRKQVAKYFGRQLVIARQEQQATIPAANGVP
jgi:hypothetical protein